MTRGRGLRLSASEGVSQDDLYPESEAQRLDPLAPFGRGEVLLCAVLKDLRFLGRFCLQNNPEPKTGLQ